MNEALSWLSFLVSVLILPGIVLGIIRKCKARLQNRLGPPLLQPFYNLFKLLGKTETVSDTASWLFRPSAAINLAVMAVVTLLVPWLSYKPAVPGDDLFLVIYLLALSRFFAILSSLDTGSPFGAFGSSREATLSLLVEPAVVLSLVALAVPAGSTDLSRIFGSGAQSSAFALPLWLLAGVGLFLASLVELSRMPIDDPTTHLELTMVHEAMIIENSAKNLALVEYTYALRMAVLYGLSAQCLLNGLWLVWPAGATMRAVL
ncbi:MAG TPA: NADH-quinone oxidoreductase subunit H, partial [Candidatus Obscuribacterales bacterium]